MLEYRPHRKKISPSSASRCASSNSRKVPQYSSAPEGLEAHSLTCSCASSAVFRAPRAEAASAQVALESKAAVEIQEGLLAVRAREVQGEDLANDVLARRIHIARALVHCGQLLQLGFPLLFNSGHLWPPESIHTSKAKAVWMSTSRAHCICIFGGTNAC